MEIEIASWLSDIKQAINEINEFLPDRKEFLVFQKDTKTKRAIERNIEIIGEAVNRILKVDPHFPLANARRAHIFSGALAGIGGLMLAYTNGSFTAAIGSQVMLPSFLGPVLGGTLLAGGAVAVLGTFIGTMLTLVIRQGLSVQGIGLETLNIALGLVLLAALSVGQIQKMFTSFKLRAKK